MGTQEYLVCFSGYEKIFGGIKNIQISWCKKKHWYLLTENVENRRSKNSSDSSRNPVIAGGDSKLTTTVKQLKLHFIEIFPFHKRKKGNVQ